MGDTTRSSLICRLPDQGGIHGDFQERNFKKPETSKAPRGADCLSVRLGLAFCKLAVEAHGGHIGVENDEGEGNAFWFTLPSGSSR